jgi:mono/diheme cytochrome c family protein
MDDWQFPVGTRFFKEFSVAGERVETRIVERIGTGARDFAFASYLWNADETEATLVAEEGVANAKGTTHSIPSKVGCLRCHGSYAYGGGRPSRGLGFGAVQLAHSATDTSLDDLIAAERLSSPPTAEIVVPGDEATRAALGYLHANCANCHNPSKDRVPQVDLDFWLGSTLASVEDSAAFITAVEQANVLFHDQHVSARIASGKPQESAVWYRMNQRGNNAQMPPLGTHTVDLEGVEKVRAWIEGLP